MQIVLIIFYLASRLLNLTILPVFADEAIYIRWAQMIIHDPHQFLFLPLYDGKTPLFIWGLVPFLRFSPLDPLFAARLLSVLVGGLTMTSLVYITRALGGTKRAEILTSLLFIALPFTLFMSRMGLIDMTVTLFLSLSFLWLIRWMNRDFSGNEIYRAGLFWGLALLTKTSALYYILIPIFFLLLGLKQKGSLWQPKLFLPFALSGLIGLGMLGSLRVSPLFPFLFQRSSDFAFTIHEIVTDLPHIVTLNTYRIGKWLVIYLTPGAWLAIAYFAISKRRSVGLLLISTGLFLLPFLLTGKLLSSRYFLPVIIWLIPATALMLESIRIKHKKLGVIFISLIVFFSIRFAYPLYTNPGKTPFAHEDVVQYLTEWSSGYGIPEVRDFILSESSNHRVVVATEGSFGTLPDGLFMYFDQNPAIKNVEIYGIGQPLSSLPDSLLQKSSIDPTYLVVNQHRMLIDPLPPTMTLINAYPRPLNGPTLQLYRINPL